VLYSRSSQYAIRALSHLATQPPRTYVPVRTVARQAQVPMPFLAKIMQQLARRRLISSQKGPNGGVALSRPAADITLESVIVAIDGLEMTRACILGLTRCDENVPCAIHDVWKGLRASLCETLHERTLADVAAAMKPRGRTSRRTAAQS
jgi:Rrf2 family protein